MKAKLSMAFQDLRGKDGPVVIKNSRQGLIVTPRTSPRNPKTAAQTFVRGNLTKAARTFENLSPSQVIAWKNYANTLTFHDPITDKSYHPTAIAAFVQCAAKFLQLNPTGTIPVTPPASAFAGDTITVEIGDFMVGALVFEASAANATGVTTELLVQRVPNVHCTPSPEGYKHAGWKAYTSGSLSTSIPLPAGIYSAAYRFVKNSTGQKSDLVVIPMGQVELSLTGSNVTQAKQLKKAA